MRILAFHPGCHDSSAAAFEDYRLVAAVEEERLTRRKGSGNGVPWLAIDEVLRIAGWSRLDVDALVSTRSFFPWRYFRYPLVKEIDYAVRRWTGPDQRQRDLMVHCQLRKTADALAIFRTDSFLGENGFRPDAKFAFANHHEAHALAALFYTDWDDALIYTADGVGDNVSYSIRTLKDGRLECHYGDDRWLLQRGPLRSSLAWAYGYATEACGFKMFRHEGKLTGLAAYGEPLLASDIAKHFWIDEIFVFPAMGDNGLAIGAALCLLLQQDGLAAWLSHRHRLDNVYLGCDYNGRIDELLGAAPGIRRLTGEPAETATNLLVGGKAGAAYVGRMEYGPRALGARSILASPADHRINDVLNKRLERSEFMPFAPYVLEEDAEKVFDISSLNRYAARFMTITCAVKPEWRERIPAVVHVDGTARPQIVRDEDNPLYADILRRFRATTGLPVLVNTSFNVHEEPIVNRPSECLKALDDGRVDFVVTEQAVYAKVGSINS